MTSPETSSAPSPSSGPAQRLNRRFAVTRVRLDPENHSAAQVDTRADYVAAEEPLEIRVDGQTVTTTMRTPGHDIELAHGFLHAEGLITSAEDIVTARYCAGATLPNGANTYNVLDITTRHAAGPQSTPPQGQPLAQPLAQPLNQPVLRPRLTTMTSACGVCGTASIEDLTKQLRHPLKQVALDPAVVARVPEILREHQAQFAKTGGIHAAGAFTFDGHPVVVREDIGRHNAADKVVGKLLFDGALPASNLMLVMSSRASFELVQKAAMAGFPALIAVSAASSLAVETARNTGMTLIGFSRGDRFNLYAGTLAT